ncbi:MAG: ribonuclease Z [Ruminococcaceae bacterium]|nr:ribonuclease Z [Oscillospiraceae bacterium]
MLDVTLLGTGGTMPTKNRRLSSAYFRLAGKGLLMDCGEGTQVSLRECGYTFKPCGIICFTHFHADHISGLPGFLLSMGNEGRTEPLNIIGPHGVEEVVNSLRIIAPELPFEIKFTELTENVQYISLNGYNITAFRVKHNITCYGYRIDIPRAGKFDPQKAQMNNVPVEVWSTLQKQETAQLNGVTYTRDMVMGAPRQGIAVTYCTDTRPCQNLEQQATFADLFICEGMYAEDEKLEKAVKSMHMTFREACGIADMAQAKRLWLTHYSPSLAEPQEYSDFADSLFNGAVVGFDGLTETINFPE